MPCKEDRKKILDSIFRSLDLIIFCSVQKADLFLRGEGGGSLWVGVEGREESHFLPASVTLHNGNFNCNSALEMPNIWLPRGTNSAHFNLLLLIPILLSVHKNHSCHLYVVKEK